MPRRDNRLIGQAQLSQISNKLIPRLSRPAACGRTRPAVVTGTLGVMRVSTYLRIIFTKPNAHISIPKLSIKRFPTQGHQAEPRPPDHPRTIPC